MKKRFRGKGRVVEETSRDEYVRVAQEQAKKQEKLQEAFRVQWQELYAQCSDPGSQTRLDRLYEQFERQKRGVSEPAQVEVEIAMLMKHAGFTVAFLEESETRTADLECYLGADRLFVEVTAIVPNPSMRRTGEMPASLELEEDLSEDDLYQDVLVRRLMARMREKARQLQRYCAPVLLAVTLPPIEWLEEEKYGQEKIDLQRLAGLLSTVLASIPQLSAVLLTCWNISAQPARSNIRLANAYWVARSEAELVLPRIRLMVTNTMATYRLGEKEFDAIKSVL